MLFSVAQLLPVGVAFFYGEQAATPFLAAFGINLVAGAVLWFTGPAKWTCAPARGFSSPCCSISVWA